MNVAGAAHRMTRSALRLGARWRRLAAGIGVTVAVLAAPGPVWAEWVTGIYLGHALTSPGNITFGGDNLRHAEFDSSATVGGRLAYWIENGFIGIAFDALYFTSDVSPQRVHSSARGQIQLGSIDLATAAFALEIALRMPLMTSPEFPAGRLQPYLLVGPALGVTQAKDSTNFGPPNQQSETRTSVGLSAGLGLGWQMTERLGLFGEYHVTTFSTTFPFRSNAAPTNTTIDLTTHHLLVGVSYRF